MEIRSTEDLEAWLEDKPIDWAQVIAVRAALRSFPVVFAINDLSDEQFDPIRKQGLFLQSFRGSFISWAALRHSVRIPDNIYAAYNAIDAAVRSSAYSRADASVRAAASVAASARAIASAPSFRPAAAAARAAADAAAYIASHAAEARRDVWAAIADDCRSLQAGEVNLINHPLWPIDVRHNPRYRANLPPWARAPFDAFAASDLARSTSFGLIIDWYRAILPSAMGRRPRSLFDEKTDIAVTLPPDEFWTITESRSAEQIMDDVAEFAGWEGKPPEGRKNTIASFIVTFLDGRDGPATIDEIRNAFASANYRIVDKTMRGELSRLAMAGRIIRVRTGVYTTASNDVEEIERSEAPTSVQQGTGPVFAAVRGELSRVPHYPFSDELANPTLQKLHDRINKRLKSLLAAFGNGLAQYPQLSDTLADYRDAVSCGTLAELDIDDLWISGAGLIAQARSFAALDPTKQVTEPLEPQLQALLGEIARLHGALIMGFAKGRELAERSGIPLLTADEFRKLYEYERTIVRWLLDSHQFAMSDKVKALFEEVDRLLVTTSEGTEHLAALGYPIIRNLIIFGAGSLGAAEKIAGRLALLGVPVHLFVNGMLPFFVENIAPIMGFASSVPELRSYLEYHLRRLEIEWEEANERPKKK